VTEFVNIGNETQSRWAVIALEQMSNQMNFYKHTDKYVKQPLLNLSEILFFFAKNKLVSQSRKVTQKQNSAVQHEPVTQEIAAVNEHS